MTVEGAVLRPGTEAAPFDERVEPGAGRGALAGYGLALAAAVALGLAVRAALVLSRDFPLNDGGLFYAMVEDLRRAGFRLPATTSYNGGAIPYGYSPLGFYLVAGLAELTGASVLSLLRYVPLAATCLTLPAFVLLARELVRDRVAVIAATLGFAVLPRSFTWLLMGGGLTRSLGFLFAILALHQLYLFYRRGRPGHAAAGGALAGLTALSHLGTAPFVAFSAALFWLACDRSRRGFLGSLAAAGLALALAAPWLLTVLRRFGAEPFLASGATGSSVFSGYESRHAVFWSLSRFGMWTGGEQLFPVVATLALLGGLVVLRERSPLLPAWWIVILLLDQRAGATYATLPVAMLAGIGAAAVLLPLLRAGRPAAPRAFAAAVLGFLVAYTVMAALLRDPDFVGVPVLDALGPADRAAMQWVASNTPPESRFLVMPSSFWEGDRAAEWFPALARRRSVATVQGTEWLRRPLDFDQRRKLSSDARACGSEGVACLDRWEAKWRVSYDYLYVPRAPLRPCCLRLLDQLAGDPRFRLVYDGPGAAVFQRVEPPGSAGVRRISAARLRGRSGSCSFRAWPKPSGTSSSAAPLPARWSRRWSPAAPSTTWCSRPRR